MWRSLFSRFHMRPPYGTNNVAEHFNLQWLELIGNKVGLSDSPSNPFDLKRLTETTLNGSSSSLKGVLLKQLSLTQQLHQSSQFVVRILSDLLVSPRKCLWRCQCAAPLCRQESVANVCNCSWRRLNWAESSWGLVLKMALPVVSFVTICATV